MIERPTARLIVLDSEGRVLLFQWEDPSVVDPGHPAETPRNPVFWCTPGGGVEPGESYEQAARRELWEETSITGVEIGPCVQSDDTMLVINGRPVLFQQRSFVVRVPLPTVSVDGLLDLERETYRTHRWWSLTELETTAETIYPEDLAEVVRSLVA
ncbi:MAG: NUDIX domain-containing protein [Chloroflexia bacterium]|nr:NUDIX domain-containing protein [Chloroflexia bacterium]